MHGVNIRVLTKAVKKDYPFVIYRLPGEKKVSVIIQQSKELVYEPFAKIDKLQGFFIAPFRGENINELICLKPDVLIDDCSETEEVFLALDGLPQVKSSKEEYAMPKKEYLESVACLVELLKEKELQKVVLSRVIDFTLPDIFKLSAYLNKLIKKYPGTFVYLARLPGKGIWIGATPEVLLRVQDDSAETVALAGTQDAKSIKWSKKEVEEQQIVMDYIKAILNKNGIADYEQTGPFTVEAGNVAHLKTSYNLSLEQLQGKTGRLIADLHPTPAVCGLPQNKSFELIGEVEKHDRSFYAGFLGPWNLTGESQLFVNLRCAELGKDKMSLYVGGGLTAESDPEAEWEETVRKSQTLLSVLKKL